MKQCSTCKFPQTTLTVPRAVPGTGTPSTLAKTAIVAMLSWLLAWRPAIAIRLGKLVLRMWPSFRRS